MFSRIRLLAAAVSLSVAGAAQAAPVTYTFDTVTSVGAGFGLTNMELVGVLLNDTTPTTVQASVNPAYYSMCLPFFLTMMEKPGRYYLVARIDTASPLSSDGLQSCTLRLR